MSTQLRARGEAQPMDLLEASRGPWYHYLYGHRSREEQGTILRPEGGDLRGDHISHLDPLIKYIQPDASLQMAFTIGNLSLNDKRHQPGRGGLALLLSVRVRDAEDAAGRQTPFFTHAVMTVNRHLSEEILYAAARAFQRHLLGDTRTRPIDRFCRDLYAQPDRREEHVAAYLGGLNQELPPLGPSSFPSVFRAYGPALMPPGPIRIAYDPGTPPQESLESVTECATRMAAVLYRSDVKWSAITMGNPVDTRPGAISVSFVRSMERLDIGIEDLPTEDPVADLFRVRIGAASPPLVSSRTRTEPPAPSPDEEALPEPSAPVACADEPTDRREARTEGPPRDVPRQEGSEATTTVRPAHELNGTGTAGPGLALSVERPVRERRSDGPLGGELAEALEVTDAGRGPPPWKEALAWARAAWPRIERAGHHVIGTLGVLAALSIIVALPLALTGHLCPHHSGRPAGVPPQATEHPAGRAAGAPLAAEQRAPHHDGGATAGPGETGAARAVVAASGEAKAGSEAKAGGGGGTRKAGGGGHGRGKANGGNARDDDEWQPPEGTGKGR